jgi:hypothetical protein
MYKYQKNDIMSKSFAFDQTYKHIYNIYKIL